jgi:outer membrane protein assembly factor BamE (lipoprotein component of BamABCDE complex)
LEKSLKSAAMKKSLPLFFWLILLAGCASVGNQAITQQGNLDRIQEGKSTKADVQNAVGTPARITPLPEGELWEYSYSHTSVNSEYVVSNETRQLSVLFDKQGIVRKIQAGNDLGYNLKFLKKLILIN